MLAVTAHPDDEASFGGTLLYYADHGVESSVICLTAGQAGSHRGKAKTDQELAAFRRKEFDSACEILRVRRCAVLDYPDGQLHRVDLQRIVADLVLRIREFRPHVMITMGPEGAVTGHTDHSMASVFATLAFHWAGRQNRFPHQLVEGCTPHRTQKLYYLTAPAPLPNRLPIALSPSTAQIRVSAYVVAKIDAFHAHKTQEPLFPLFDSHVEKLGGVELFHLAANVTPGPVAAEEDLFAGVVEG